MKIYDVNRNNAEAKRANADWQTDSKSRDYQNQIANAQNRLKDLSVDKALGEEEKAEKRKEIQRQITELNNQLRQHQIQMQRELREKTADTEAVKEKQEQNIKEETDASSSGAQNAMRAVFSANSAISHAQAHGNIALEMEGRVRILQNEIKQDIQYGRDTAQKQKELEKLEKKAVRVKGAKMSYLANASREMKRAAETEREADHNLKKKKKTDSTHPAASFLNPSVKQKTDLYIKGNMFSNVDFHF